VGGDAGHRAGPLVERLADAIEERGHDLALLDAIDSGAPIGVMDLDVDGRRPIHALPDQVNI
jgi:hypothetical protein